MLINHDDKIFIAGRRGMVGSAIWRALQAAGYEHLVGPNSSQLNLTVQADVERFVADQQPDAVVLAAARVGGILANSSYPADFIGDNLNIQTNVLGACRNAKVRRLLFLGSSCIYPKFAPQPIEEHALLTGPLEPTNEAYAVAKIAGIVQVQSVRRQDGLSWVSAMPTNLYGPGDNFDLQNAHVLPALLRRFHEAELTGQPEVVVWGTGQARREFMHVDDLATACVRVLEEYDDDDPINIGTGTDISIRELAELIAGIVGYRGRVTFDASKPDGTPRKLLSVSKLERLGFAPDVPLQDGIQMLYSWYQSDSGREAAARRSERNSRPLLRVASTEISEDQAWTYLSEYARTNEAVIRNYDCAGGDKPTLVPVVDFATLGRLVFMGRALSATQSMAALEAARMAPWDDVPLDAQLVHADPDVTAGLYDSAESLYRHFLDTRPAIGSASVSALLHLARPGLYPLLDLRVRRAYDALAQEAWGRIEKPVRPRSRRSYWPVIRDDLVRAHPVLQQLRKRLSESDVPAERQLGTVSDVRLWDVLVRCQSSEAGFEPFRDDKRDD